MNHAAPCHVPFALVASSVHMFSNLDSSAVWSAAAAASLACLPAFLRAFLLMPNTTH